MPEPRYTGAWCGRTTRRGFVLKALATGLLLGSCRDDNQPAPTLPVTNTTIQPPAPPTPTGTTPPVAAASVTTTTVPPTHTATVSPSPTTPGTSTPPAPLPTSTLPALSFARVPMTIDGHTIELPLGLTMSVYAEN